MGLVVAWSTSGTQACIISLPLAVRSGPGGCGLGGREQKHTQAIEVSLELIFYRETSDNGGVALLP